ncbi:MAG: hypothetical protein N2314_08920 [Brevinematales bacterium]|nr:hypothetical protein [Brevinematales bacterium]
MKKKKLSFLVGMVLLGMGCGFVMEDEAAKRVDYREVVSYLQPLTNAKGTSYGISTSGINETSPQVYHAPWGKSYLFFVRQSSLYAAEMFSDGRIGEARVVRESTYPFVVFDGEYAGTKKAWLGTDSGTIYELKSDLSLQGVADFSSEVFAVDVWDGTKWETWGVYRDSFDNFLKRVKLTYMLGAGWQVSSVTIIASPEATELLYAPMGGIGVFSSQETNFVFLGTKEVSLGQTTTSVFQQILVTMKGGAITTNVRPVYVGLYGVSSPFVDGKTYEVYFSMEESLGSGVSDLYRFRYLTWEKMVPTEIRAKLP